jgi:hypothetical protein
LACCCDSIRWRGSRRALEEASQDSSSENSTNAGLVSAEREVAVVIFLTVISP